MVRNVLVSNLDWRFVDALQFAYKLHETQVRKRAGTGAVGDRSIPYFAHLMAVSALVIESGGSESEAMAALLHDALEDGPECLAHKRACSNFSRVSEDFQKDIRETIVARFGHEVARIVEECSEDKFIVDKAMRKRNYLAALNTASCSASLVMLCDKIHNAESIVMDLSRLGESTWQKFSLGKAASLAFYREALEIFKAKTDDARLRPLVLRFAVAVKAMESTKIGENA